MRNLSSARTFWFKVLFPVLWISGFGFGTLMLWLDVIKSNDGASPPEEMKWQFLAMWIVGSLFIIWSSGRLKRVRIDSNCLYVSNYLRELTIPLSSISSVTENRWLNIHPVTIHLHHVTEFGRKVTFMPKIRWSWSWSRHPVVAELRQLSGLSQS